MEDSQDSSEAGKYLSLLNVPSDDPVRLAGVIDRVFQSYTASIEDLAGEHLFIQPMVDNIALSGVVFTRELSDGSPYYIINYDDESGKTDTITGGTGVSKTVFVYRESTRADFDSDRLHAIFEFAKRVEAVFVSDALDIEFAMNLDGDIYLLQARPISTTKKWAGDVDAVVRNNIDFVSAFFSRGLSRTPLLCGSRTLWGVMPDWNPAEMIGVNPHPLSSSLYRELITKRVWSKAREATGYRSMPPAELMVVVAGRPYIDVRASMNSFLPKGVGKDIGEKLISAWLDYIDNHPEFHDKIEFNVAQTSMDFCFDRNLDSRYPGLLSPSERDRFRKVLTRLTVNCLDLGPKGSMVRSERAVATLERRQRSRRLPDGQYPQHAMNYIEECQLLGTVPFSILARHAFISEAVLRSAVEREALSDDRARALKASIHTISGEMSKQFVAVIKGELDRDVFLQRFGHLRPGSYDILSPRYEDRAQLFCSTAEMPPYKSVKRFSFTRTEESALRLLLAEAGMESVTPKQFLQYVKRAVRGREYAKFVFTRNVSDILEMVAAWGQDIGLEREDLAFIDIQDVINWNSISLLRDPSEYFSAQVEKGRDLYSLGRSLKLSHFIRSPRDVRVVPQHRSAPNFIGSGSIEAPVVKLDSYASCDTRISGNIVCIENADPGFDWVFTRGIKGLVTLFGGSNSHMAIRCAEYELPAAIGVGRKLFSEISSAGRAVLNADGKRLVKVL
jgi:hypothetical protein